MSTPFTFKEAVWTFAVLQFAMIGFAIIRAGFVGGRMPTNREDVLALQKKAKSKWDPIGEEGIKRMRWISYGLFILLVIFGLTSAHWSS